MRLSGQAFVTNNQGHPLMVTRPSGELELPGGVAVGEEPALQPVAYHLRRLGLTTRPGPVLLVDHVEATPLGAVGDRLNFIFGCGELSPGEIASIGSPKLPDDVTSWQFVDLKYFHAGITPYHRRCLDAAVATLTSGARTPYLRNALRISAQLSVPA
ncbi:hypothetical protein VR41_12635 [Streptomyces sp. NRRL B-1568]|nr:hypothetical protein VR41_12635 [Streptomyces sp. NRRL B-1568]